MRDGDHTAAFSYFQKAADRGYSKAQYNVGLCHEHGRGTPWVRSQVPYLLPATGLMACTVWPPATSRNQQWAGLAKSSFALSAGRRKEERRLQLLGF